MDVKSGNSVSLKKKREDILNSSERNILRRIFGRAREREREREREWDVGIKLMKNFI